MATYTKSKSAGSLILQISLAILFLIQGINTVFYGSLPFRQLFGSDELGKIVGIILGIVEIAAGVILIIQFFTPVGSSVNSLFLLILLIVVIAEIVFYDVLGSHGLMYGKIFASRDRFFSFLESLAGHLLMLGAIIIVKN
jgi:uncharacterized membrane protein YphA (DoxX/SURF4 family)